MVLCLTSCNGYSKTIQCLPPISHLPFIHTIEGSSFYFVLVFYGILYFNLEASWMWYPFSFIHVGGHCLCWSWARRKQERSRRKTKDRPQVIIATLYHIDILLVKHCKPLMIQITNTSMFVSWPVIGCISMVGIMAAVGSRFENLMYKNWILLGKVTFCSILKVCEW